MIKVAIVDDQALLIQGLKMIVEENEEMSVLWTAENGEQALHMCQTALPELILMDIRMPQMNGVEATAHIKKAFPHVKILVLTTFNEDDYIIGALKEGASGYLLKDATPEQIIEAIQTISSGGMMLGPEVTPKLVDKLMGKSEGAGSKEREYSIKLAQLTQKEQDVAHWVSEGFSNKEIAELMFISEGTVKNHLTRILEKLDLRDRTQLAIYILKT